MRHERILILSCTIALSFVVSFSSQTDAAEFGDCLSWLWGGKNEATTYSPPYPTNYTPTAQEERQRSTEPGNSYNSGQSVLGQTAGSAPTVYVSPSPSYTVVGPNPCFDAAYYARKPDAANSDNSVQDTTLQPVITKEWSYSRVESVKYKPVEIIDPNTGVTSTAYREEKSKTLLPWLHQKEKIEYKPVLAYKPTLNSNISVSPLFSTPLSVPPQITQANYPGSASVPHESYMPGPCANPIPTPCAAEGSEGIVIGQSVGSESIPYFPAQGATFERNPEASTRSSTYFSQGGRSSRYSNITNFGIPPVRDGHEQDRSSAFISDPSSLSNVPSSAADTIPVIEPGTGSGYPEHLQKPAENLDAISVSADDIGPAQPYSETLKQREKEEEEKSRQAAEESQKAELSKKETPEKEKTEAPAIIQVSSNLIRTPAPDLPTLNKPKEQSDEPDQKEFSRYNVKKTMKRTAPTQMFK